MKEFDDSGPSDLFIIGGGINGCGIARDASGRGLSVRLAEKGDLAQGTSSASTKLFHGGLRYLEFFEFRLVRESLIERETLLRAMPHIAWPMRFVLPYQQGMRFEATTPASRLLSIFMPWMKGHRPAWLIRLGLFLYDRLGGRKLLRGTETISLSGTPEGAPLQRRFEKAFEYSDCWVQDARLVVLNARDAEARGARIMTRTEVVGAASEDGLWRVDTKDVETGRVSTYRARMLVNAGGPWVGDILGARLRLNTADRIRLVRGSHIVTRKLYDHDKCYFFQGTDGRIMFAIPYEEDFTLLGTTEADHDTPARKPEITPEETRYLLDFANRYFRENISEGDIVWTYSGVRPLYDDGSSSATAATRDYTLKVEVRDGAPVLNVFGGKITTYRRLAESALSKIAEQLTCDRRGWTAGVPLPGGDFPVDGAAALKDELRRDYHILDSQWARRLVRAYGTEAWEILGDASVSSDLGKAFGATLTEAEVIWLMDKEHARVAEDVVWRRSKLGLRLERREIAALDRWMQARRQEVRSTAG